MNEIDKIFKNKLEDFKVKPADFAWQSIESQLSSNSNGGHYSLKIAASLVIILVSSIIGYFVFNANPKESVERSIAIADKNLPQPLNTESNQPVVSSNPAITENESSKDSHSIANNPEIKRVYFRELPKVKSILVADNSNLNNQLTGRIKPIQYAPITITLADIETEDLPPVSISYKSSKNLESGATSDEEKESTLKKAWDYALSVKNGEERPFNIKEMKNELFAFDFKKKKSKTQD